MWLRKRLIMDRDSGMPLGWWPEYEGSHIPKSWLSGHAIIFFKNYCDLISKWLENMARECLEVVDYEHLKAPKWEKLCDSYNVKEYVLALSESKYHSALIYGPPGSGKSTVSKSLQKNWLVLC